MVKISILNFCFQKNKFILLENDECDLMKRSICTDPDIDEYSIKATRTLYIGNLQSEISYNELREAYSAYGDIIVCI
jgi:RNA recognition motif-containing protein